MLTPGERRPRPASLFALETLSPLLSTLAAQLLAFVVFSGLQMTSESLWLSETLVLAPREAAARAGFVQKDLTARLAWGSAEFLVLLSCLAGVVIGGRTLLEALRPRPRRDRAAFPGDLRRCAQVPRRDPH